MIYAVTGSCRSVESSCGEANRYVEGPAESSDLGGVAHCSYIYIDIVTGDNKTVNNK